MQRIVLGRERLRQVWIAFPVRICVTVGEPRISDHVCAVVMCDAAMRQRVTVRMAYKIARRCASGEITFAGRITPRASWIPMPRFHVQLSVLPVRNSLPTG